MKLPVATLFFSLLRVGGDGVGAATCGNGSVGDGICPGAGFCCSQWGYCGSTSDYCGSSPNPPPTPPPPPPTSPPVWAPPTPPPAPATASGTPCGYGVVGDGVCPGAGFCCSQFGWCGTGESYCGSSNPPPTPPPTPPPHHIAPHNPPAPPTWWTPPPTPPPTSPPIDAIRSGATCGGGSVGNGICANAGDCCSQWGYCGSSSDYCSGGSSPPPPTPPPVWNPPPTPPPTPLPVWMPPNPPPSPPPTPPPTPLPVWTPPSPTPPTSTGSGSGTCGYGVVGDGVCPGAGFCCSPYGWCGTGDAYCDSISNPPPAPPSWTPPTPPPTPLPVWSPTPPTSSSAASAVEAVLQANSYNIDSKLLLYELPSDSWGTPQWAPSTIYRCADMIDAVRVMARDGVGNRFLYMGEDNVPNGHHYGLVNIAAFLAQAMKETIRYNACDENSWDQPGGKYALSNACGQLGQSYQDYSCSAAEAHMECPVRADMEITATTHAQWWGAPAPLFCGPKSKYPFSGFWDYSYECNNPWSSPPETCNVYEGQTAGRFDNTSPVPNASGRTDVEGCCFWGRGVIQTTGVCNFGKLNYWLGARAAAEGRGSRYPNINFCDTPNAICDSVAHKELKWIAGLFYWIESVQSYSVGGWVYMTELKKFVDNGMTGNAFIDSVSGIVNRGCHSPPCGSGNVEGTSDRSSNFHKVLAEFRLV